MANITLIVTGGTRAPTGLDLLDRFLEDGHEVRLIASKNALRFLWSHMLRRPSRIPRFLRHFRPEIRETFAYFKEKISDVPHISEGKWADVLVMAPATCNSVGKMVAGVSDNYPLLTIRAVPRTKKVIVVPSMNPEMWYDPHFQRNVDLLNATVKYKVLCPSRGQMLSGDYGFGAQVPFEDIINETYRALGILDGEVEAYLDGRSPTVPWETDSSETNEDDIQNIVLVDEDRTVREQISKGLQREYPDYRVHQFDTGSQAMAWLKENQAGIIFTEMTFDHGVTGHDLIEFCRRPGVADGMQIIATSSKDRREVGAERMSLQDVLFLPKPLNIPFAVGMVAGCLRGTKQSSAMTIRTLSEGEVLFREGDEGSEIYVVESGSLRIVRQDGSKEIELGIADAGEMIGEMAFLGASTRSATIIAAEETKLVELDLNEFRTYMESQPVWLRKMINSLIEHLRDTSERMVEATKKTKIQKAKSKKKQKTRS